MTVLSPEGLRCDTGVVLSPLQAASATDIGEAAPVAQESLEGSDLKHVASTLETRSVILSMRQMSGATVLPTEGTLFQLFNSEPKARAPLRFGGGAFPWGGLEEGGS